MTRREECAAMLLAAELYVLDDFATPEEAIAHSRRVIMAAETDEPWTNGRHMGDCTKVACCCMRCLRESWLEKTKDFDGCFSDESNRIS